MRTIPYLAGLLLAALLLAGCGESRTVAPMAQTTAAHLPHGGAGLVSPASVGPLRIDRSNAVQVQDFAGPADYIGAGRFVPRMHSFAPFIALGYACSHSASGGIPTMASKMGTPYDSHVRCKTVYFINQRTDKLAAFWTASHRFHTAVGVRVGTSLAKAEHAEHLGLMDDPKALNVHTKAADLLIYATIVVPKNGSWHAGKSVLALSVESNLQQVGLQFV